MGNKKTFHMVTASLSVILMKGQLDYLSKKGFNMGVISSPGKELDNLEVSEKIAIPMEREINIPKDIKSLIQLINTLIKEKPIILNAGTPKAGLLGMVASFVARVPNRIYTLRGLRLETSTGWKRKILWMCEKIACTLSTKVVCISPSLRDRTVELKLVDKSKTVVFANGSSNGINTNRYPEPATQKEKIKDLKQELGIGHSDFILGFVGRVTKDKGINELVEAFISIQSQYKNTKLLILGNFEDSDPIKDSVREEVENNDNIIYLGFVSDPIPYYYLIDLLIFPTHREGFGNVSIQAQATGTPVLTTNATGAVDTVEDGHTGYIVPVGDTESIIQKVIHLKDNDELREEMSVNARSRALKEYDSVLIWKEMANFYQSLLKQEVSNKEQLKN